MDNLIVYKDNYLVEASYRLTLMEQHLMLYSIGKLNPQEPEREFRIVVDDFIKQFPDINKSKVYSQIKNAIDTLGERWVKVKDPKYIKEFRWISAKKYFNDQGSAMISFSPEVMPYLCQLEKQFTNYQLRNIGGFKRTYSIRIYELLTQYRSLKFCTISLLDFRVALQLDNKYREYKKLRKQVINPSIDEINEKSDLKVAYKPLRKGRSIDSIEFFIEVDKQIDMFEKKEKIKKLKENLNIK